MPNKHRSPLCVHDIHDAHTPSDTAGPGTSHRLAAAPLLTCPPEAGRRRLLQGSLGLLASGGLLGLGGCGGAEDDKIANVRVVNATTGFTTAKLWIEDQVMATSVAYGGSLTRYYQIAPGTRSFALQANTAAGAAGSSITGSFSLSAGEVSTLLVHGDGSPAGGRILRLIESEPQPASTSVKLRLLHLAPSLTALGGLSLYTSAAADLAGETPVASVSGYGATPDGFVTVPRGSYRLRVASTSNPAQVVFDSGGNLNLTGTSVITLALVPRSKTATLPNICALYERNSDSGVWPNNLAG